jgi:hypothetical protein
MTSDSTNRSTEQNFTKWATQSVISDSSWGSIAESTRRSRLVHPLSPTSFHSFHSCLTQRTEVTVASMDDRQDLEDHVISAPISPDGTALGEKELPTKL